LWRKVNCADVLVMAMDGESSRLSLMTLGSFTHPALGKESATGVGNPEFEVCQNTPSGSIALVAVHPAGSVGGVTLSKFSLKLGGHGIGMGPRSRTVACASPVPLLAIQPTSCTTPVVGFVKVNDP
jgi:hypothetical protein